jgi:hypothetical protein
VRWWIFAMLVGCGDAGRAKDCERAAELIKSGQGLHDEEWQNPDVRAAVMSYTGGVWADRTAASDWSMYTPYSVSSDPGGPARIYDYDKRSPWPTPRASGSFLGMFETRRHSKRRDLYRVCPEIERD